VVSKDTHTMPIHPRMKRPAGKAVSVIKTRLCYFSITLIGNKPRQELRDSTSHNCCRLFAKN